MSKADFSDSARVVAWLDGAIAIAEEALTTEGTDVVAAYRELAPVVDKLELRQEMPFSLIAKRALVARWRDALARIHEAVHGYRPDGAVPSVPAGGIVRELDPETLRAVMDLVSIEDECAGGGATVVQLSDAVARAVKAAGLKVPKKHILRLTAYFAGAPIPPV
jgi:hypothetical protein